MEVRFTGICSGTEKRHSERSGKDYWITKFVEFPSLDKLEVFGDLGLPAHVDPREYVLSGQINGMGNVKVLSAGGVNVPSAAPVVPPAKK